MLAAIYVICTIWWVVHAILAASTPIGIARIRYSVRGMESLCVLAVFITPGVPAKIATAVLFQAVLLSMILVGMYFDAMMRAEAKKYHVSETDEESLSTEIVLYESKRRRMTVSVERAAKMERTMGLLMITFLIGMLVMRICLIFPDYGAGGWSMFYIVCALGLFYGIMDSNEEMNEKICEVTKTIPLSTIECIAIGMVFFILIFGAVQGMTWCVYTVMDASHDDSDLQTTSQRYELDPLDECAEISDHYSGDTSGYYVLFSKYQQRYYFYSSTESRDLKIAHSGNVRVFYDDDPEAPATAWVVVHETGYEARLSHKWLTETTEYELHVPAKDYVLSL